MSEDQIANLSYEVYYTVIGENVSDGWYLQF